MAKKIIVVIMGLSIGFFAGYIWDNNKDEKKPKKETLRPTEQECEANEALGELTDEMINNFQ